LLDKSLDRISFPVIAEVRVDLPEPELPTNMVVFFVRNSSRWFKCVKNFAEISNVFIPIFS
jgi:hypothetical protein